jgi:hypothetical protein
MLRAAFLKLPSLPTLNVNQNQKVSFAVRRFSDSELKVTPSAVYQSLFLTQVFKVSKKLDAN